MELKELIEKINQHFKDNGWYDKLKFMLISKDFEKIIGQLALIKNEGKHFFPPISTVLHPFDLVSPEEIKTIVIEGSPMEKETDRITIYSNNWIESLKFKELYGSIDEFAKEHKVLFLKESMTTSSYQHTKIWYPFISYVIDVCHVKTIGINTIKNYDETTDLTNLINLLL